MLEASQAGNTDRPDDRADHRAQLNALGSPEAPNPAAVVVLAAGEGRRMHSATPKVLHPIAGRPLLGHAVHAAAALAPEHLVVVAGHGRDQVREYLSELAVELSRSALLAIQEQQRGTGHAVACALDSLPAISGPVMVTYGDVPLLDSGTLRGLLTEHAAAGNAITVLTAELADPTGYGRVLRGSGDLAGTITGIVEQRDGTPEQLAIQEINSGVYVFEADVLRDGLAKLTELAPANAQGEQYLTDVVGLAHAAGRRVGALRCPDPWLVCGVNDRLQLAEIGAELNRRLLASWMRSGVTVIDPASTWVDVGVRLERDVVLHPGIQLHGATTVCSGAEIGPDSTLTNCWVGSDARVVRTHANGAEVGAGANVGPFAYLRPGTRLGELGKIGGFVETKNATIGRGSKVPHLTYVGDATIGEGTNIGASSVFVNYDGVTKHHSVIGSYARTGSDTMFVAPITVGDGAYVGAGTVLREDVPPGALAVSAGEQRNIEGWVIRRRPGTPAAMAAEQALAAQSHSDASPTSGTPEQVGSVEPGDTVGTPTAPHGGNSHC
ncbi:MAG: bifunctional UDP-N-acetylglucosamine pyrophosphorylase / glucosamine-phosphate N-acetyltransferase [Pseudonocardiales bacterium]|jgi:bifunctional UDP-N-acetylglucosamine pyrophosphorylase/glucosamine-1-phosphate N-acetyltransferase|nr:bifunctional UDP-N-acetylglucosamine pyrophosphorylase / glucosamine-phosphate N-acetyltransferase [Pseudonocardiales bacterium]MDT7624661.1 bifunctional UDP-N-acetylglucosamine pyrophosphorylase / glucosamine-phosphate N-acetyltransferase [Pseudonocardiales bacterium]MDT7629940.1 bifunctional UDP-N-acetylglucosamine pyrophosphorylase / glucosamine-phosphate N-acetyltransferase [Pseudonocardiales bacterium]MDT7658977.1 bifunctional UDP-N-acetylglucosamine pyrophosphorylase / glucosamine-phosp